MFDDVLALDFALDMNNEYWTFINNIFHAKKIINV